MSHKQKYKFPKVQKKRGKKHPYTIRKEDNYTPLIYDMTLQRTIGNMEVQRMFKTGEILAKLFVNQPGDIYEQEADRVAEQIVNMGDKEIQLKSTETKIQRKGSPGKENISSQLETKINTLKGKGRPLEPKIRDYLQPRFGVDLGDVRVHTDSNADRLARAIRAKAFTHGNDVVFAKGTYNPASKEGKKLIAHELTHVIQQTNKIQKKLPTKKVDNTVRQEDKTAAIISKNTLKENIPGYLLQTMKNNNYDNSLQFHKEIQHFQKKNPPSSIKRKQEKIFASQKPVQIKLKDNSETLRRWTSCEREPKVTATIGPVNITTPNRLPPTKSTIVAIIISGTIPSGKHIDIDVEGSGGDNGVATIISGNQLTSSGTVTVEAGTASQQTKPGHAGSLKIRAKLDGVTIGHSAGFTIAAYPENYKESFNNDINTSTAVGLIVNDDWESDGTGNISDLDEVQISELVGLDSRDNPPFTSGGGTSTTSGTSGYLSGDQRTSDRHSYGKAFIDTSTLAQDPTQIYTIVYTQLCLFKCKRTNVLDKVMPQSGYTITHKVWWDATASKWKHQAIKAGAAVTVGSYSVTAGSIVGASCDSSEHDL